MSFSALPAVAEQLPVMTAWEPADRGTVWINSAIAAFFGTDARDVPHETIEGVVHPDDLGLYLAATTQLRSTQRPTRVELRARRHDGAWRRLLIEMTPWRGGDGAVLGNTAIVFDVTEARAYEVERSLRAQLEAAVEERTAELSAANEALARAARLKDEFLATMSHELRTPLNAVLGLSEALLDDLGPALPARSREDLELIHQSGTHLLALINDVLDLSKIEAGRGTLTFTDVAAAQTLSAAAKLVAPDAQRKGVMLQRSLPPESLLVRTDARALKQIVVNLLGNAVKFTAPGGTVRLDAQLRDATAPDADPELVLTVADTGIGIPRDQLPRLFRPFEQLDTRLTREHGGTGLGLAIVSRLIEGLGGRLEVASTVGEGSRFTVILPAPRAQGERSDPSPETPVPVPGLARRVLLAEDNVANQRTYKGYLTAHGYRVTVAADGLDAIEQVRVARPDVVLMDIQMPRLDGVAAIAALRADPAFRELPIIAITALAMPGDEARVRAAGADRYLPKPFRLGTLLDHIEQLLAPPR